MGVWGILCGAILCPAGGTHTLSAIEGLVEEIGESKFLVSKNLGDTFLL